MLEVLTHVEWDDSMQLVLSDISAEVGVSTKAVDVSHAEEREFIHIEPVHRVDEIEMHGKLLRI